MSSSNTVKTIAFITLAAFCFTQCAFAADFLRQGQAAGGPMAKAIDADVRGLDSGEELRFRLALFLAAGKFTEAQQELLSFLDRPVAGPEEKRLAVIEDNAHEWAARALISNYLHNLKGPHQRGNLIKFLQSLHNMYAQKRTSYMQRVPTGKRQQAARIFELPQEVSVNNILDALSRYEKEGDKIAIKQAENLLSKLLMEIYLRYYSLKKYMEYMTESNNKTIEPAQGDYLPVVVTGGAGFIGATVVDMLLNNKNGIADDLLLHNGVTLRGNYKGIKIYVIDNFETGEPWKLLQYKNAIKESRLVVIPADFSKPEDVERLKQEYPGIFSGVVIHEGAFVSVPESIKNPSLCFDANKTGSFNIMNLTREAGGKVVVVSTAATVSGPSLNDDGSYKAVDEKSAYNPATYYGFTKAIMEWFAKLMQFEERPLQQTTIAYSNVTGPGQMVRGEAAVGPAVAMRVIEYARQLREWKYNGQIGEKPTPLFTIFNAGFDEPVNTQWNRDGGIRDYIPVDLAAEAAITAAFRKHNGDFIRIGNGTKMSVKEYYYRLAKALVDAGATYGISLEELGFNEGPWREGDAPYSVFNNTHMKQTLGLKGPSEEDYNKLFARIAEFYKKLFHRSYADDETKHIANTEQWRARQQKQLDRIFELQTESRANAGGNRHNDINVRKAAQAGITEGKRFSNCTVVRHFNHVFSVKLGETGYMGMVSTRTLPVEVERDRSSWPAIGSTVVCKQYRIFGLINSSY